MDGFRLHFGWDCAEGDTACVPASQDEIDRDQGVINGLFGAGATVGAVATPWVFDRFGRKRSLFTSSWIFIFGAAIQGGAVNVSAFIVISRQASLLASSISFLVTNLFGILFFLLRVYEHCADEYDVGRPSLLRM